MVLNKNDGDAKLFPYNLVVDDLKKKKTRKMKVTFVKLILIKILTF